MFDMELYIAIVLLASVVTTQQNFHHDNPVDGNQTPLARALRSVHVTLTIKRKSILKNNSETSYPAPPPPSTSFASPGEDRFVPLPHEDPPPAYDMTEPAEEATEWMDPKMFYSFQPFSLYDDKDTSPPPNSPISRLGGMRAVTREPLQLSQTNAPTARPRTTNRTLGNEWLRASGGDMKLFAEGKTWSEAARTCRTLGGYLATIRNDDDKAEMLKLLGASTPVNVDAEVLMYVGYNGTSGKLRPIVETADIVIPANYSPMCTEYVADVKEEECGALSAICLGVTATSCNLNLPFMCERPY